MKSIARVVPLFSVIILICHFGCSHSVTASGGHSSWGVRYDPISDLPSVVSAPKDSFSVFADFDHPSNPQPGKSAPFVNIYYVNNTEKERMVSGDWYGDINLEAETKPGVWERVIPYHVHITEYPTRISVPARHFYRGYAPYFNRGTRYNVRYIIVPHGNRVPPSNTGWESFADTLFQLAHYDDLAIQEGDSTFLAGIIERRTDFIPDGRQSLSHMPSIPGVNWGYRSPVPPALKDLNQRFPGKSTAALIRTVIADTMANRIDLAAAARTLYDPGRGARDTAAVQLLRSVLLRSSTVDYPLEECFRALEWLSPTDAAGIAAKLLEEGKGDKTMSFWRILSRRLHFFNEMLRDSSLFSIIHSHRYDVQSIVFDRIIWSYAFYRSPDLHDYLISIFRSDTIAPRAREVATERFGVCFPNHVFKTSLQLIDTALPGNGRIRFRFSVKNISQQAFLLNADSIHEMLCLKLSMNGKRNDSVFAAFTVDSLGASGIREISPGGSWDVVVSVDIGNPFGDVKGDKVSISMGGSECRIPSLYEIPDRISFTYPTYLWRQ